MGWPQADRQAGWLTSDMYIGIRADARPMPKTMSCPTSITARLPYFEIQETWLRATFGELMNTGRITHL